MAFMEKEIVYGAFWQADTSNDGLCSMPCDLFGREETAKMWDVEAGDVEQLSGWFARMSAPGYLDCTEWSGPFDSQEAADEYLEEYYSDDEEDGLGEALNLL